MLEFGPKQTLLAKSPTDVKICKTCAHFVRQPGLFPDASYGRCRLFGAIDLVTGEKELKYASIVRKYEADCGQDGRLHAPQSTPSPGGH